VRGLATTVRVPGLRARSSAQMPCDLADGAPRHVYIDLGVNWGNTLRLHEDIDPANASRYRVFGFEASPLIQPFADHYVAWLNGDAEHEPENCLPRSGSSDHLVEYAAAYGCGSVNASLSKAVQERQKSDVRNCMWDKLSAHLSMLHPDPQLNSSALTSSRLASAAQSCGPRYTLIPAAAGAAVDPPWLTFYSPPHQLIRGGSIMDAHAGRAKANSVFEGDDAYNFKVRVVDVASWLETSFRLEDHIFVKLDAEGAEFHILEQLIRRNKLSLIDVLSIECHKFAGNCTQLLRGAASAAPTMRILTERTAHKGYDSRSKTSRETQRRIAQACAALDPRYFVLSRRSSSPPELQAGQRRKTNPALSVSI